MFKQLSDFVWHNSERVWSQGPLACRRKEKKALSDEENSEMDADPSTSEEEAAGPLNITDEMKRMLNQLWVVVHKNTLVIIKILSRHHVVKWKAAHKNK